MRTGNHYTVYQPPRELLDESGRPLKYHPYTPSRPSTGRTVLDISHENNLPIEEIAIVDGLWLLHDREKAAGKHIDTLVLLGELALDYVVEREKLPAPDDSNRIRKLKQRCRTQRLIGSGVVSRHGAIVMSAGIHTPMLRTASQQTDPPALTYTEADPLDAALVRGYTVDYANNNLWESPLPNSVYLHQTGLTIDLEIGLEYRRRSTAHTEKKIGIYKISVGQSVVMSPASIESLESPGAISIDEVTFVIAVLSESIAEIQRYSPYPEHRAVLRQQGLGRITSLFRSSD